jgi:pimeloyl-ACP methyl ester carboxylesterase
MFRNSHQVVTWDYRGHGKSELKKDAKGYSLSSIVKDCKSVIDELDLKKAVFIGHSLGVQVIFEIYRHWPERVAGLIPCFGTYGHPMDSFYNTRLSRYLFEITYRLAINFPKQGNWISHLLLRNPLSFYMGGIFKIMNIGMVNKEDIDRYIKHILAVDPIFFNRLLKSAQEHSAEDMLKTIEVPTLIVAGEHDQFTPMWISKKMHRLIPESELFVMHRATHAGLVEQPDLINLKIEKFVQERVKRRPS